MNVAITKIRNVRLKSGGDTRLCHCIYHYASFPAISKTIQAKNNVRNASASAALSQISHRSHNAHTTNRHLRGKGERNGKQNRTKLSLIEP